MRVDLTEPLEPMAPPSGLSVDPAGNGEAHEAEAAGHRAGRRRPRVLGVVALAVIVGVGALLRFWNLDRVGFRGDEAVYAGQAAVMAGVDELQRYFILMSRGNSNFLLYQRIVSLAYRMFGVSDVLARVVAATFCTLTIVVVFAIARTLYTRRTALIAALLLAVSSYSVALARLALLDATLTFLVALAMLCLARWDRTSRPVWLYAFGACVALAIQAKIVGVLLLPILGVYLLVSRRRVPAGVVGIAAAAFLVFLSPVLLDLASNGREFGDFLSRSSRRVSHVPWTYYPTVLLGREGVVVVLLWTAGVVVAVVRRSRADLLPGLWLLGFVGFYQLYPLKAFNYLLPSVPALCLLAARAVEKLPRPSAQGARVAAAGALVVLLAAGVVPHQWRALHDDSFAGLEESARWLAANSPPDAGVMTLSHGSAQYVFSFYAQRDAYPFGRFRLATVLPGGKIVHALPSAEWHHAPGLGRVVAAQAARGRVGRLPRLLRHLDHDRRPGGGRARQHLDPAEVPRADRPVRGPAGPHGVREPRGSGVDLQGVPAAEEAGRHPLGRWGSGQGPRLGLHDGRPGHGALPRAAGRHDPRRRGRVGSAVVPGPGQGPAAVVRRADRLGGQLRVVRGAVRAPCRRQGWG